MLPPASLVVLLVAILVVLVRSVRWTPPDEVSRWVLATRLTLFVFFAHRSYVVLKSSHVMTFKWLRGSKFTNRTVVVNQLLLFTVQSWLLQTVHFLVGGLFDLTFTLSHLVTTVTTFVLVPRADAESSIFSTNQLILHNCNVVAANVDALVSNARLRSGTGAALWCTCYTLFAWGWGVQFDFVPYFFLDYTLPLHIAMAFHLGLLGFVFLVSWAAAALTSLLHGAPFLLRLCVHTVLVLAITHVKRPT